jgi:hypothetical protein
MTNPFNKGDRVRVLQDLASIGGTSVAKGSVGTVISPCVHGCTSVQFGDSVQHVATAQLEPVEQFKPGDRVVVSPTKTPNGFAVSGGPGTVIGLCKIMADYIKVSFDDGLSRTVPVSSVQPLEEEEQQTTTLLELNQVLRIYKTGRGFCIQVNNEKFHGNQNDLGRVMDAFRKINE